MNRVGVSIEVDLPEGVRLRGYERFEDGRTLEVDWQLPEHCRCSKCEREAAASICSNHRASLLNEAAGAAVFG